MISNNLIGYQHSFYSSDYEAGLQVWTGLRCVCVCFLFFVLVGLVGIQFVCVCLSVCCVCVCYKSLCSFISACAEWSCTDRKLGNRNRKLLWLLICLMSCRGWNVPLCSGDCLETKCQAWDSTHTHTYRHSRRLCAVFAWLVRALMLFWL